MKVSYKWLKEMVDLEGVSFEQLVNDISFYSIEVEGTENVTNVKSIDDEPKIIVGYVETKEKHPNADKLSVCMVNTGKETLQIVCGAPNVKAGMKIMLALPGAVLPNGTIKTSEIRGIKSNGMICSLAELGLDSKYIPEEFAHGIYVLDDDAPLGVDAVEYLMLDDKSIELGLTPNRMDLLSMRGVANDVAAIYSKTVTNECGDVESKARCNDDVEKYLTISSTTDKCLSYNARVVRNVKIGPSPKFIKSRLIASGIRPINNVVDITNYILVLFGQPLHAFDEDVLGNKIVVRTALEKEEVVTLDGQKRLLNENDIVITDGEKVTCIAGVMGCENTEVTENTKNVVIEAAVFDSLSVRKTSARLGLRSESSTRFERGVDLNQTKEALDYACYLLSEYAGGDVLKGTLSLGIAQLPCKEITITEADVNKYLGISISTEEISNILERLQLPTIEENNVLKVFVPNRRMDISIKPDLIEEIIRIYGYKNLKETIPASNSLGKLTIPQKRRRLIRNVLASKGLNEIMSYTLVSEDESKKFDVFGDSENRKTIKLLHPMSEDRSTVRMSLIPSILNVVKYNIARKNTNLAFFELGNNYYLEAEEVKYETMLSGFMCGEFINQSGLSANTTVDFYLVKGILESLFKTLGIKLKYQKLEKKVPELHPERTASIYYDGELIGYLGALHPEYVHSNDLIDGYVFEIKLDKVLNANLPVTVFKPISKTPAVYRDIALVIPDDMQVGDIIDAIYKVDKETIKNVEVFDIYKGLTLGANVRSVAFRITLEADTTLTEDVISTKLQKIIKMAEYRFNVKLRG